MDTTNDKECVRCGEVNGFKPYIVSDHCTKCLRELGDGDAFDGIRKLSS